MGTDEFIPVSEPTFAEGREEEYVLDCIRTGWISSEGKYVRDFERAWAEYCAVSEGIAVSSGTAALEIAVKCLGLEPGDEVILPSFTIISCVNAVINAGGAPILVDSDPDTWTMDVSAIEEKITPRTRAIMAVHIYGHPVDMDPLCEIATRHGLRVIEDAAEAHGGEYKGRRCGGLADISIFSFYANKIVTTGEGGMVLTNDPDIANRARSLRNLCFGTEQRFLHSGIGHVYRMTNVQAAIGLAQIERIDSFIEKKHAIARFYNEALSDEPRIQRPIERDWANNVYWMYGIVLDDDLPLDASNVMKKMRAKNIDTRPFFLGLHEQPALKELGLFANVRFPVTERIARRGLYLPSGLTLTDSQQERICAALKEILTGR